MLSIAARRLGALSRDMPVSLIAARGFASTAVGKAATVGDVERFDPGQWFQDFSDPQIRAQLNKLREIENELISTVSPQRMPVDWAQWESEIKYPGLVKELKEIHDSIPIPDIEAEKAKLAKKMDDIFDPIVAEFAELSKNAEAEIERLEKRASEITYIRDNVDKLTVDEFLERYPTVKASIEDDIANNRWFINE